MGRVDSHAETRKRKLKPQEDNMELLRVFVTPKRGVLFELVKVGVGVGVQVRFLIVSVLPGENI